MHWIYLSLAIIFEVLGTISMKLSNGFTKLVPSILLLLLFYIGSLCFLTLTLKYISVSIAYAVWSGMGIVLISLIGIFFFHEQFSVIKAVSVLLIIIGVVSLNFISESETSSNGISVHTDRNR
ncbi:DMT family transporter [Bacillus siamensis]|uniref:DMT family transporter n=1 Tax=Bacillus siamensis TaxID=659243 RepID=UPI0039ED3775